MSTKTDIKNKKSEALHYKHSDIIGNPKAVSEKGKLGKGIKKRKTIIKDELGLKTTKDLAGLVKELGDDLLKDAKKNWQKRFFIWKELVKIALPKTTVSVEKTFEDFLKDEENKLNNN